MTGVNKREEEAWRSIGRSEEIMRKRGEAKKAEEERKDWIRRFAAAALPDAIRRNDECNQGEEIPFHIRAKFAGGTAASLAVALWDELERRFKEEDTP